MSAADRAAALVSWWVATYTRQLSGEIGERRRAEIASDLWEHRSAGRQDRTAAILVAWSILWRMAAGMPADLRWRSGQLAAAHRAPPPERERWLLQALARNWWLVLAGLVGMTEVVVGAAIVLGAGAATGTGPTERAGPTVGGGMLILGAGLIVLLGILWRRRSPNAGMVLIVAGAIPALLLSPWSFPLAVVVVAGLAFVLTVRPGGRDARGRSAPQLAMRLGSHATALSVLYLVLAGRVPVWPGLALLGLLAVGYGLRRRDRPT
jgi:hypothetical protein